MIVLKSSLNTYLKWVPLYLVFFFHFDSVNAQCTSIAFLNKIIAIENDTVKSIESKLRKTIELKENANTCQIPKDSVYARILHRIGVFEYKIGNYNRAIINTLQSAQINSGGTKNCSKAFLEKSYSNLAVFYREVKQIDKSIEYFDKTIQLVSSGEKDTSKLLTLKLDKDKLVFKKGDYQKSIEDNLLNLSVAQKFSDSYFIAYFFNRLSQAYYTQKKILLANRFADSGYVYANKINDIFEKGTSLKLKALANAGNVLFNDLLKSEVQLRIEYGDMGELAGDYIDFGNVFFDQYKNYTKAKEFYLKSAYYATKASDIEKLAIANSNLGLVSYYQNDYKKAVEYYLNVFRLIGLNNYSNDFLKNPTAKQLHAIPNKELSLVLLGNKTELLLCMYKKNADRNYLDASLKTAMLTDSLITQMRNEQFGKESKLYWRNRTNEFFRNAMEASFLASNAEKAFYFLEKSRAVLLNDALNEIGADKLLPPNEITVQERMQIKIIELQGRLSGFNDTSATYHAIQLQLAGMRDSIGNFIKSLNQKYPAYYQYKYDDVVPSLKELQQYLARNNQSFIHYFVGDTVTYILGITPNNTKFIRLSKNEFDKAQLAEFLQFCSRKEALIKTEGYAAFKQLSHSVYKKIFEQLQLPKGRVVVCMDNIVIPFEALCTDNTGRNFLINNYSFDYVYSARFLLKQFSNPPAQGNFAGFAPVSFNSALKVVELTNAANALDASAVFYPNDKLFTYKNASKHNFFEYAPSYAVVNIFSHAYADTTDNEPVLFMQDSKIHLSELQKLNDPATRLVLLSACQTNVGKNATGEGIYSLARGFASAGIPSVAATLWAADEATIYAISEKFNQYLSEGMTKDEALRKAKLEFMKANEGSEKMLPYYWANMILIGNADAISLETAGSNLNIVWIVTAIFAIGVICLVLLRRKKNTVSGKV